MLSPETWQFTSPASASARVTLLGDTVDVTENKRFTHSVSVICPDLLKVPDECHNIFSEHCHYEILNCSPVLFVDEEFLKYFIEEGSLQCISLKSIAEIDVVILMSSEHGLTIQLSKEIYETLGLTAKKIKSSFGVFYEISINLNSESFYPGNNMAEKTETALKKLGCFNFAINWEPHNKSICPSSIAKYFHDKGITVHPKYVEIYQDHHPTYVPCLDKGYIKEILEWEGLLLIRGTTNTENDYVNSYSYSGPLINHCERVCTLRAHGLFSGNVIRRISHILRNYINERDPTLWVGLNTISRKAGARLIGEDSTFCYMFSKRFSFLATNNP